MITDKIADFLTLIPLLIEENKASKIKPEAEILTIEAICVPSDSLIEQAINRELKSLPLQVLAGAEAKKLSIIFHQAFDDSIKGMGTLLEAKDGFEESLSVSLFMSEDKALSILDLSNKVPLRFFIDIKISSLVPGFVFEVTKFSVEGISFESSKGRVIH